MEVKFKKFDHLLDVFLDESISNFKYCNGKLAYEWTANKEPQLKEAKPDEGGIYEQSICNFLLSPNHEKTAGRNNIIVIIGGSGTGKSTTLNYCIKEISKNTISHTISANASVRRPQKSNDILIDFRYLDVTDQDPESIDVMDMFWRYIAEKAKKSLINHQQISEMPNFWKWCLSQSDLLFHCHKIQVFLYDNEDAIECYLSRKAYLIYGSGVNLLNYLSDKKEQLFKSFDAKGMAWYNLLLLINQIKNRENWENDLKNEYGYPHLLIDNIDHLPPYLQAKAVDLAILLASTLELKTIINIRPLTWVQAVQGQYLIEQKYHYAPDPLEVILSRLNKILASHCEDEVTKSYITKVITLINGEYKLGDTRKTILQQMINATSGISIRYALRNIHNMLKSNIVRDKYLLENQKLSVNEIARSFFFGEREHFLGHAFDNIYSVHHKLDQSHSLIKARILDFVLRIRTGVSKIREVFQFCQKFGYQEDDIKDALEELMLRSRALLWSAEGWKIKKADSFAEIMITPIGRNYINLLFGELFYIEVCLAKHAQDHTLVQQVISFDRKIGEKDSEDIKIFIKNYGADQYKKFYSVGLDEITSLSLKHYYKLRSGIDKIKGQYVGALQFDEKRDLYLKSIMSELLN